MYLNTYLIYVKYVFKYEQVYLYYIHYTFYIT